MNKWKENGFTADGQFACKICQGTKIMTLASGVIFECVGCIGSGYMVDYLNRKLEHEQFKNEEKQKDLNKLIQWIRRTSKCTLCKGDSYNKPYFFPCEECGLEGTQPMGG